MLLVWFMPSVIAKCSETIMEYTKISQELARELDRRRVDVRHCGWALFISYFWAQTPLIGGQVNPNRSCLWRRRESGLTSVVMLAGAKVTTIPGLMTPVSTRPAMERRNIEVKLCKKISPRIRSLQKLKSERKVSPI